MDPYGRFFSAQEQTGASGECGMHCIRNLLQRDDITKESLTESAEAVAKITGDSIDNHEYSGAWWSSDVIIHNLTDRGYIVNYHYNEDIDFEDPSIVGYIIHIPKKFHFITVRRSSRTEHSVEVVDSMAGIETMRKRRLTLNAKQNEWNIICVKKTTDVDPVV